MSKKQRGRDDAKLLDDILNTLREQREDDITAYYGGFTIRLAAYLRVATIGQIRESGGTVDPNVTIPVAVKRLLEKRVAIDEKLNEVRGCFQEQVTEYYNKLKKQLPEETLKKKMGDLTVEEWRLIGIDPTNVMQKVQ